MTGKVSGFAPRVSAPLVPLLIVSFILISTALLPTDSFAKVQKVYIKKTSLIAYDIERAEFFYFTGDYLSASALANRILRYPAIDKKIKTRSGNRLRNRVLLLKWLSDLRLNYYKEDSANTFRGVSLEALPGLLEVFEAIYSQGEYDVMGSLSGQLEGAAARYLEALSLYKKNKFRESDSLLRTIQKRDAVYPYAVIMLSQIKIIMGSSKTALKYLDNLEESLAAGKLRDNVTLLTGYILFEDGDYIKADKRLRNIKKGSSFIRAATITRAWSMVKAGRFEATLALIEELKPLRIYDRDSQELMLIEAYSRMQRGELDAAEILVAETINMLQKLGDGYNKLYTEKKIPEGFLLDIADLRTEHMAKSAGSGTMDEVMEAIRLASAIRDEPELRRSSAYFRAFKTIRTIFQRREAEVLMNYLTLSERIKAKRASLADVKRRSKLIAEILASLGPRTMKKAGGKAYFLESELDSSHINSRWEKRLNRNLTDLEGRIIRLVTLDGTSGLWYLDNTVYCQFLYWMAIDLTKDRPGGYGLAILERIVKDIRVSFEGGETGYERLLPEIALAVLKKIDDDTALLALLDNLKNELTENRAKAKAAEERILRELELIVVRRAGMMQNEIRPVYKNALKLLEDIEKAKLDVPKVLEPVAKEK